MPATVPHALVCHPDTPDDAVRALRRYLDTVEDDPEALAAVERVFAAVKLQELFGLAETPRVGAQQTPVTFELLAPNGRPVQVTRDLRSFWERGYLEVRKELRGRYPKHPWPDDPWTATPTRRAKPRGT